MEKSREIRPLSNRRLERMRAQGYTAQSAGEIAELAFGIRFAYKLCTAILIIGLYTTNVYLLGAMMTVASFAIILPKHPFDYLYNSFLSESMGLPKLPAHEPQMKFGCAIATIWIASIIYFIQVGNISIANLLGIVMISLASSASLLDLCIPSIVYNAIFRTRSAV
jgi:hypothetical protein